MTAYELLVAHVENVQAMLKSHGGALGCPPEGAPQRRVRAQLSF